MADFTDLETLEQQGILGDIFEPKGAVAGGRFDEKKRRPRVQGTQPGFTQARRQGGSMFMPGLPTPAEQYQMSQGALGAAMKAIDKENYSRVSQSREMRRMAHEQELERIRASAAMARANADRETALIRELLSGM
jgi:hypothetical protein